MTKDKPLSEKMNERIEKWIEDKNELSNVGVGLSSYGIDCRIDEIKEVKRDVKEAVKNLKLSNKEIFEKYKYEWGLYNGNEFKMIKEIFDAMTEQIDKIFGSFEK